MSPQTKHFIYCCIAATLLILFISSCSINKKVHKEKEKEETKKETTAVNTSTVTDETTGTIETKADSICNYAPADSVLAGKEIVTENEKFKSTTKFNPKTRNIETNTVIKPQSAPVNIKKTTVSSETVNVKEQSVKEKSVKNKDVSTEIFQYWWIVMIIIAIVLLFLVYRYFGGR